MRSTDERSKARVKLASTMACKEEEDDSQILRFLEAFKGIASKMLELAEG